MVDNICVVCLEDLGDNYKNLQCGHNFHYDCILEWFRKSKEGTCPCCLDVPENLGYLYGEHYINWRYNNIKKYINKNKNIIFKKEIDDIINENNILKGLKKERAILNKDNSFKKKKRKEKQLNSLFYRQKTKIKKKKLKLISHFPSVCY